MFDCLGEKETGGFIDGCDTPPPEFWIHFDGKIYIHLTMNSSKY
jgi:hypothetical protein